VESGSKKESVPVFETFDHTADVGIRARAGDLPGLLVEAARGLFSLIAEPVPDDPPGSRIEIRVRGDRADLLLFDWLSELLYVSDRDRTVLIGFEVALVEGGLEGRARAISVDDAGIVLLHEVKAITYHGLSVERDGAEWVAEFIVDV
jgi:SHS2 domain-containing protein